MMHILPNGFYKIRYYGILATASIKTKRQQAIALIEKVVWQPMLEGLNAYEVYRTLRGNDPARCHKCKACESRQKCTQSKNGIYIDRREYADVTEANARRVEENPAYYKLRQQVTEHPFGTLKRQRGFTFTLVRSKEKVLGEVGLMFIGYNLSRCVSILGAVKLIKALKDSCLRVFTGSKTAYFKLIS